MQTVNSEKKSENKNDKVVIELDIQNYFENAHVDVLLRNLDQFVKPSEKRILNFDTSTQELIKFFFQFLNKGEPSIIQSYQNIISSFLGYLYLLFGDLIILEAIQKLDPKGSFIQDKKVIRYMDDTFISLTFKSSNSKKKKKQFILGLLNEIGQKFNDELNLRFNKKFGLYFLNVKKDTKKLSTRIKYNSLGGTQESGEETKKGNVKAQESNTAEEIEKLNKEANAALLKFFNAPNEKIESLFTLLKKIKKQGIDFLYNSFADKIPKYKEDIDSILKFVYDHNVSNILKSKNKIQELEKIMDKFPFEVFRLNSKAFTVIISNAPKARKSYRKYLLGLKNVTLFEAALIHDYLTQIKINDFKLLNKLQENKSWIPIVKANKKRVVFPRRDYCKKSWKHLITFEKDRNILEQVRLRRYHESLKDYSGALNHLLNEFHAICRVLDKEAGSGKKYDVNKVVTYLLKRNIGTNKVIGIRNLFDRRNKNPISHPGENELVAWAVSEVEYKKYQKVVLESLNIILSKK